jgi:transposase-like protein
MALWLASARRPLASEIAALHERLAKVQGENDLLRSRLERIDPQRRPRYAPWERLRILLHRARYGLSVESTARTFLVSGQTVLNWLDEVERGAARLIQSREPMNALPGLVREISFFLKREWPRWGTRRIAGILARLGLKASRTSVQRILRRPSFRPASRCRRGRGGSPLRARHVGHLWVVDFTVVRTFFRSIVVGAVLDASSRKALALRVWAAEPDAAGACLLVRDAIRAHGRPTWLVSDRGLQFRSSQFKSMLARWGIRRRFAALGDPNLSRIDRFWRAMKDEFARGLFLFKRLRALERQLRGYARWHGAERPHQGLGHRAPDDVHARRPRRLIRHLEGGILEVTFSDGDRRLPLFRLRSSA